jgi:tetratricopeptide (TPR) repeat protein
MKRVLYILFLGLLLAAVCPEAWAQSPAPQSSAPGQPAAGEPATPSQKGDSRVRSGNRYYKRKQLDQSEKEYQAALQQAPDNPAAHYNLGNTQFRKNNFDGAAKSYDATIDHTADKAVREKSYYNKGVAEIKQKKLQESVDSWKNALRIDPADEEARENLQKALLELKKQQQQQKDQKDQKDKKDPKDKKDKKDQKDQQDQQKKQDQQPKPQPSRLNKQQVEQLLKALQQKEKEVQEKVNQNKAKAPNQPDKDW